MNIFDKIKRQYKQNLPFVVYNKPNETTISGFFQTSDTLFYTKDFSETGFVFAPFDANEKAILFAKETSEFITEEFITEEFIIKETSFSDNSKAKEAHINLIAKAISVIKDKQFKKVVLSRKEEVQLSDFNIITTFKNILSTYKNAFAYVWFHPKVGLWFGATPETLLKVADRNFETMALAGTQNFSETINVKWESKEIEEQQFVTDYIEQNLQPLVENLEVSEVKTVKAGNLLHLKTVIKGNFQLPTSNYHKALRALHPTPAVCGLPLEPSKKFILDNENYKRSFYTGFLGEINHKKQEIRNKKQDISNFYVNLRCIEIIDDKAIIYVGGGITKDSNPTKEWEETVAKTKVMKRVL